MKKPQLYKQKMSLCKTPAGGVFVCKMPACGRHTGARLALFAFDTAFLFAFALVTLACFPSAALAYVDPSVMTYTIQALAGVAVALSAVLGVAMRRTRKALMKLFGIDENAHKQSDEPWYALDEKGRSVEAGSFAGAENLAAGSFAAGNFASTGNLAAGNFAGTGSSSSSVAATQKSGPKHANDAENTQRGALAFASGQSFLGQGPKHAAPSSKRKKNNAGTGAAASALALKWPARFLCACLVAIFATFTLLVAAPYEILAGASGDLVFGLDDAWVIFVLPACIIALVLALGLSLFRGRAFQIVLLLVFSFGLACYVQALLLNGQLPKADGRAIDWSQFTSSYIISTFVWLLILVLPQLLSIWFAKPCRGVALLLSFSLLIVQGIGVASLFVEVPATYVQTSSQQTSNDADAGGATDTSAAADTNSAATDANAAADTSTTDAAQTSATTNDTTATDTTTNTTAEQDTTSEQASAIMTQKGLYNLSSNKNVVVFVLDTYDTSDLDTLLASDPSALNEFSGFTYFHNSTGVILPTRYAIPYLLTGRTLPSESVDSNAESTAANSNEGSAAIANSNTAATTDTAAGTAANSSTPTNSATSAGVGSVKTDEEIINETNTTSAQDLVDYMAYRYTPATFLDDIKQAGYSIGIWSDSLYSGGEWSDAKYPFNNAINSYIYNMQTGDNVIGIDDLSSVLMLYKCAFYRDMPWLFKENFWFYTDEINKAMVIKTEKDALDDVPYTMDDASFYTNLKSVGLSIKQEGESQGDFRFIHLLGAHAPYTINANGEALTNGETSLEEQCAGTMKMVSEYLRQLKALGLYNNTTVIVTADHGFYDVLNYDAEEFLTRPSSPIFLVKPANQSIEDMNAPYKVSNVETGHLDFQATVLDAMGYTSDTYSVFGGIPAFQVQEDMSRKRVYYASTTNGNDDDGFKKYLITGNVLDFNNWHLTKKAWSYYGHN